MRVAVGVATLVDVAAFFEGDFPPAFAAGFLVVGVLGMGVVYSRSTGDREIRTRW
jgi:hypothetical protein